MKNHRKMRVRLALIFSLVVLAATGKVIAEQNEAPHPIERGNPVITSVEQSATTIPLYELLELTMHIDAAFDNPYDPDQVDLSATFSSPTGRTLKVIGFYHREFQRFPAFPDVVAATDDWSWKIRFAPDEEGPWTYIVRLTTVDGTAQVTGGAFEATAPHGKGFLRPDPRSDGLTYLRHTTGEPFFGIGENLSWWRHKPSDYEVWLKHLGENGANLIRIWMASWSFALEWQDTGLGRYDLRQDRADHLDHVLDIAGQYGINVMLVLQNHGQFSARTNPEWDHNPFNQRNGGPLQTPEQFFTDEAATSLTQQRYRYIVARYGYRTNILTWELFNEVDLTDGYRSDAVARWHRDMAAYIKSIDPFDHPVTTSFSNPMLDDEVWHLPEIDLTSTHFYNAPDMAASVIDHDRRKMQLYHKPTWVAEFGTDWRGAGHEDLSGVNLHNALWASAFSGAAGAAMTWWWDTYVADRHMYHHFATISAFLGDFDWIDRGFAPARPAVKTASMGPWIIPANVDWGAKPTETDIWVSDQGRAEGPDVIARFMHGQQYNANLRTDPVTFHVTSDTPIEIGVEVATAARAGARLVISIDDEVALNEAFAAANSDTPVGHTYSVSVPPGTHRVTFQNTGTDWLAIGGYVVQDVMPKVRSWALVGEDGALLWVQDREHTWSRVAQGYEPPLIDDAQVTLIGLLDGAYEVEIWDTWQGVVSQRRTVQSVGGQLAIELPPFHRDIAAKVHKLP